MIQPKVALVTGSGKRRVGYFVAEALARRGYALAIHYNSSAEAAQESQRQLQAIGTRAAIFQADLTREDAIRNLMQGVKTEFGRLDVLVNCAASWPRQQLEEITAEHLRSAFETNTLSTFLCSQLAGLLMASQPEGGCIVTVGDWATERPYMDHAAYLVSKGAIPTLTRVLAVELGRRNPQVRVNCVLPGPVMLPPQLSEAERQHVINVTLVRREGRPENVAQAVLSLIDNDFVTGACLPVDGGRSIYAGES